MRMRRRDVLRKVLSMVLSRAEPEDATTYQLCKRYVDRYRGENNDDITTNGELAFMKQRLAESRVVVDAGARLGARTIAGEVDAGRRSDIDSGCAYP